MKVLSSVDHPEKQLQNEIVNYCRGCLEKGEQRRKKIKNINDWKKYKEDILGVIKSAFPHSMFDRSNPLNARVVSKHEFNDFRIENVLFESLAGWEVNGTVYMPKKRGIYPGVVVPTGHSGKSYKNYQTASQILARNGYIVISFDPPGVDGELKYMNDHFTNGLIGYLTGFWSQTHFVVDALRCVDYLETRDDVDVSKGFSMTGVSGGGLTTIFGSMIDERIKFSAPVCCLSEHEVIHLTDFYTSCPEQFGNKYIQEGLDYADYISIIAPRDCLIVAGKKDDVYDFNTTRKLFSEAQEVYSEIGIKEKLNLYIDEDSGHGYTVKMANEVVRHMNMIIKKTQKKPMDLNEDDVRLLDRKTLNCYPSNETNMYTINKKEGARLRKLRHTNESNKEIFKNKAVKLLNIKESYNVVSVEEEKNPPDRWFHTLQKVDIVGEEGNHIPGLLLRRNIENKRPGLLFVDEKGKWNGLRQNGYLAQAGRFLKVDYIEKEPIILSIDCSGFGELSMEPCSYDMASWNDIERILTYLSIASNRSIMSLRIRDALCAIKYLEIREDVDEIIIGGRGIGAIVALHAAAVWGKVSKIICVDMLANYQEMTEKFPYKWEPSIVIPNILKEYDLDELVASLTGTPILIINPLDAQKNQVGLDYMKAIYENSNNKNIEIITNASAEILNSEFSRFIHR